MQNIKLSPHFKLYEFCVTSQGANLIQANREFASKPENVEKLSILSNNVLEPIRAVLVDPKNGFGLKFLTITSGVRSPEVNKGIANSSKTSRHLHAECADFVVDGTLANTQKLFKMIMNNEVQGLYPKKWIAQCILERKKRADGNWSSWIHVGIITDDFKKYRKAANRNYTNFPEYMISLDGFKYVLANETNLNKYLQ